MTFSFSHIQDGVAGRGTATRFTLDFSISIIIYEPGKQEDGKETRREGDGRDGRDEMR